MALTKNQKIALGVGGAVVGGILLWAIFSPKKTVQQQQQTGGNPIPPTPTPITQPPPTSDLPYNDMAADLLIALSYRRNASDDGWLFNSDGLLKVFSNVKTADQFRKLGTAFAASLAYDDRFKADILYALIQSYSPVDAGKDAHTFLSEQLPNLKNIGLVLPN